MSKRKNKSAATTSGSGTAVSLGASETDALKAKLGKAPVPQQLYQHPDPLLRRLRVLDPYGKPANLQQTFRDAKVVAFLFGSDAPRGKVEAYYKDLMHFTTSHPHRFKCVYVSVDTTEQNYIANTKNRPWLSLPWDDGSNLTTGEEADFPDKRLEDFLRGEEEDSEADIVAKDPTGEVYVRPWARTHLARHFDVLYVPTLIVYSVDQRKILSTRVKPELLKRERQDATWALWEKGETADLNFNDIIYSMRWTLTLLVCTLIYLVSVIVTGENPLAELIESLGKRKSVV